MAEVNTRKVFVVHGRNMAARDAMFAFLRAIGLEPIEWTTAVRATGSGSPYIGQALDAAFKMAQAVVVLLTPDDIAYLRHEYASGDDDPETVATPQARPNVLFEAGMALGHHPDRTILVELGALRPFSDVAGRHTIRLDNSSQRRNDLANRLRDAGCDANTADSDWLNEGNFTPPAAPSGPLGRRVANSANRSKKHLDATFLGRSSGNAHIRLVNVGSEDVFNLTSPNEDELLGAIHGFPIPRLPVGKSKNLSTLLASGSPDTFDLIVNGCTESDEEFSESLYLDLDG